MSLLQEMQNVKRMIDEENDPALKTYYKRTSSALEDYCEETGADIGKVMFTQEGWDQLLEWLEKKKK